MSSKQIKQLTNESNKMQPKTNQLPQLTQIDVFNSPKVQYVNINIQSLHVHESSMNNKFMIFLTFRV